MLRRAITVRFGQRKEEEEEEEEEVQQKMNNNNNNNEGGSGRSLLCLSEAGLMTFSK